MLNKILFMRLISIFFVILLVFSNIGTSNLSLQNSKTNDIKIAKSNFKLNPKNEWYDGYFHGSWGRDNSCSDGKIWGGLNFGRRSTLGDFFGEWNASDDSSFGSINGRFRNNFLLGIIRNNNNESVLFFIGFISFNDSKFKAIIFNPKLPIIRINGEHESSFLPPITGNYGVGVKTMHLIDESRLENFTEDDPDDYREMMVQLWYPINKEIKEPRAEYMDAPSFAWLKGRSPIPLFMIPNKAYLFIRPHMKNEISIANDEQYYPIIIFSPGYDGVYQIYSSFIEEMVSHGFIVASINHPYVSGITVFPDGREVYISKDPPGNLSLLSVVEDAKFVLDKLTEMNNTDPDFNGRFDLSKVGMYGHSFGGASTSICLYEDDRFDCGLTLDGVFYTDVIPDGINKPFLLMIAENRFNNDNVQDMWNHLMGDSYIVQINGSTHYAFTDVGVLLKHLVPLIPINILGFGSIAPKLMVNITRAIILTFFEVYLKGESVENLTNLLKSIDEIQFEIK